MMIHAHIAITSRHRSGAQGHKERPCIFALPSHKNAFRNRDTTLHNNNAPAQPTRSQTQLPITTDHGRSSSRMLHVSTRSINDRSRTRLTNRARETTARLSRHNRRVIRKGRPLNWCDLGRIERLR